MLVLPLEPMVPECAYTVGLDYSLDVLHQHFGHICERWLRMLLKARRIKPSTNKLSPCEICIKNKTMCKLVCKGPAPCSETPMERLHTDVCGPFPVPMFTGKCYFVSVIDNTM
jgi:hypothetical protein